MPQWKVRKYEECAAFVDAQPRQVKEICDFRFLIFDLLFGLGALCGTLRGLR
jgi:hypothetical protein